MAKLLVALLFGSIFMTSAFASNGRVVVDCKSSTFSDLKKIQILETDQTGRYVIVETSFDSTSKQDVTRETSAFGLKEIQENDMPPLSNWDGYTRKFNRLGVDVYSIDFYDECGGGTAYQMSCKESF